MYHHHRTFLSDRAKACLSLSAISKIYLCYGSWLRMFQPFTVLTGVIYKSLKKLSQTIGLEGSWYVSSSGKALLWEFGPFQISHSWSQLAVPDQSLNLLLPLRKNRDHQIAEYLNYCYPRNKILLERVWKALSWLADKFQYFWRCENVLCPPWLNRNNEVSFAI